jgi:hypothetical protein
VGTVQSDGVVMWYVTLDGVPVVDAVTGSPLMGVDDALCLQHDLEVCHPTSEVTLWKGRQV